MLKGEAVRIGKISDISPCGLSIAYLADKKEENDFKHVDIQLKQAEFQMEGLPCKVVHNGIDLSMCTKGQICHRCGLQFGEMNDAHKDQLNFFLSNFTTGVKKGRQIPSIVMDKLKIARIFLIPLFVDFLLLTTAILGMQFLKRQVFMVPPRYLVLFGVFYLAWLCISVATEKYRHILTRSWRHGLAMIVKANVLLLYAVSFSVLVSETLSAVSRLQVFGTCAVYFMLEILALGIVQKVRKRPSARPAGASLSTAEVSGKYSTGMVIVDALLLFIAFLLLNYLKRGSLIFQPRYDLALMMMVAMWAFSMLYSRKFNFATYNASFTTVFNHCVRAVLIMGAGMAVIIFFGRWHYYSRLQIFGTPAALLAMETVTFYLFWLYRRRGRIGNDIETADEVTQTLTAKENGFDLPADRQDALLSDPVETKLKYALEFFDPRLYAFIEGAIDLSKIDRSATALMKTDAIDALHPLANNSYNLLVNLHKTNDVRWFNRYFLEVHRKLKNQGVFIGKVHTVATHRKHYVEKYPALLANLFYGINFIWCRVFPKLPVLKKLYFTITQGRNRMVSKAEIFGRLYFCGFKVLDSMEIDNRLYFIARKVRIPAYQTNPTYGPLVQLKRIGFNGEMINVYKFRTMFPYSEFLQEYIYATNSLQEGGKFKDDFRITGWGKFMRALWLDELPMLYNWLKGDLKVFGVRPLSRHYLSLYTDEVRQMRIQVLPGLIPPFYADMPKTLDEIIESEYRYLQAYLHSPMRTQLSYMWRSSVNILVHGARSG
ncbi:sugar transferase [Desulfosarcina variabilis str. Montpellier]